MESKKSKRGGYRPGAGRKPLPPTEKALTKTIRVDVLQADAAREVGRLHSTKPFITLVRLESLRIFVTVYNRDNPIQEIFDDHSSAMQWIIKNYSWIDSVICLNYKNFAMLNVISQHYFKGITFPRYILSIPLLFGGLIDFRVYQDKFGDETKHHIHIDEFRKLLVECDKSGEYVADKWGIRSVHEGAHFRLFTNDLSVDIHISSAEMLGLMNDKKDSLVDVWVETSSYSDFFELYKSPV